MGGNVPLGYDLGERRLVVNPVEAEQVRHIFSRYLELRSGVGLMKELRREGIASKQWVSRAGQERGGTAFSCGALYYLLQNRLYLGEIIYRGVSHAGEHEAIIGSKLFDAVQMTLAANRQERRDNPKRESGCILAGMVRGSDGQPLTTSFSYGRGGRLYRYYVAGSLDPARSTPLRPIRRIPAAPLERLVLQALSRMLQRQLTWAEALRRLCFVELQERSVQLVLNPDTLMEPHEPVAAAIDRLQPLVIPHRIASDGNRLRLIIDREPVFRGGRALAQRLNESAHAAGAAELLKAAHRLLEAHSMSPLNLAADSLATAPRWQRQRRCMALGLIAPELQRAIMRGSFAGSPARLLAGAPLAWADQILMTKT